MTEVVILLLVIILVGVAMIWGVRWSRKGIDDVNKSHVFDPEQIGPYDLFVAGGSSYWKVFFKQFGSFFEMGKPMIMSEWDSFFSKVFIGLLVLFVILAACFVGT